MTTDELRAKFEAWFRSKFTRWSPDKSGGVMAWLGYQQGYVSRDAEVEALQDALFQISVRLKAERESDMDDMSWHTDMIARAQYLANQCQRIESAPVGEIVCGRANSFGGYHVEIAHDVSWVKGKRVRLVVEDGE